MSANLILKNAAVSLAIISIAAGAVVAVAPVNEVGASSKSNGGICFQPHQSPGKSASGSWGFAESDGKGVSYSVNSGYEISICAKAGRGNNTRTVSGSGYVPTPQGKDLSHWAYKVKTVPAQTEADAEPQVESEQELLPQTSSTSTIKPQVLPATLPKTGAGSILTVFAGFSSLGYVVHRLLVRFK